MWQCHIILDCHVNISPKQELTLSFQGSNGTGWVWAWDQGGRAIREACVHPGIAQDDATLSQGGDEASGG